MGAILSAGILNTFFKRAVIAKQNPIGASQGVNLFARHAAPLHADDVKARKIGAIAGVRRTETFVNLTVKYK